MGGGDRQRNGDEHQEHKGRRGGDAGDRHPHGLPMSPFGRMARKTRSAAKMTR